jgi:hypothetical protein
VTWLSKIDRPKIGHPGGVTGKVAGEGTKEPDGPGIGRPRPVSSLRMGSRHRSTGRIVRFAARTGNGVMRLPIRAAQGMVGATAETHAARGHGRRPNETSYGPSPRRRPIYRGLAGQFDFSRPARRTNSPVSSGRAWWRRWSGRVCPGADAYRLTGGRAMCLVVIAF